MNNFCSLFLIDDLFDLVVQLIDMIGIATDFTSKRQKLMELVIERLLIKVRVRGLKVSVSTKCQS